MVNEINNREQQDNRRASMTSSGGGHANASETTPLVGGGQGATISWSSCSPKLKGAIVVCTVFALAMLLVSLVLASILVARTSDRRHQDLCALSKSVPQLGPTRAEWPTHGTTSMAKLAAYIHVYDLGFLPLDINRMTVTKTDAQNGQVSLVDDCVNLTVGFTINDDTSSLTSISWSSAGDLTRTLRSVTGDIYDKCASYSPSWGHRFPTKNRYSCLDREVVQCLKYGNEGQQRPVAELVIDSFELELFGDGDKIRRGHFSKSAYLRSCSN